METTWKPTVAGVLCILAGAADVGLGVLILVAGGIIREAFAFTEIARLADLVIAVSPVWFVLGIVAIIGGIYALRRRVWGLALAGSICALSGYVVFGILAIVFVAMARAEFDQRPGASPRAHT
jgi:hypothetical protein